MELVQRRRPPERGKLRCTSWCFGMSFEGGGNIGEVNKNTTRLIAIKAMQRLSMQQEASDL